MEDLSHISSNCTRLGSIESHVTELKKTDSDWLRIFGGNIIIYNLETVEHIFAVT